MTVAGVIGIDARKLHDGGIGRYLQGLLGALAALDGPERYVVFLAPGPTGELPPRLASRLILPRFRLVPCAAPLYSLRELFAFRSARARVGLDLLHFPHYVRALSPGCPVAVTVHDATHLSHPPSIPARWYARVMMTWSARSAACLITATGAARDDIAARLGIEPSRFTVTPYGVDSWFAPPSRDTCARFRGNRALEGEYLLCLGTHRPHKNVPEAVRAFREAQLPSGELVLAAPDARTAEALRCFEGQGVRLLREVTDEEMPALYATARGVVAPSLAEGFGLGPLEAMACGAPVLASAIGAHREVLGDAAAFFDPAAGPSALAAAMRAFWEDGERRAALAAGGPARAGRFTWARTAELTRDAYREAAVVRLARASTLS